MKNATSISSADLNGESTYEGKLDIYNLIYVEPSFGDKFKSYAYNFTMFAAEKAKDLKEKSSSVINKIQEKYGK